jgi:hypothetical protein
MDRKGGGSFAIAIEYAMLSYRRKPVSSRNNLARRANFNMDPAVKPRDDKFGD